MLKAALSHRGTVMLDVVSPCVTFNDHEGSTKSYKFMKDHEEPLHDINFVPKFQEIDVDYDPGTTVNVTMHDGSALRLHKLEEHYDPTNKIGAIKRIMESHEADEVLTGVLYLNTTAPNFIDMLNMTDEPLGTLARERDSALAQGVGRMHGRVAVDQFDTNANALFAEGVSIAKALLLLRRWLAEAPCDKIPAWRRTKANSNLPAPVVVHC